MDHLFNYFYNIERQFDGCENIAMNTSGYIGLYQYRTLADCRLFNVFGQLLLF